MCVYIYIYIHAHTYSKYTRTYRYVRYIYEDRCGHGGFDIRSVGNVGSKDSPEAQKQYRNRLSSVCFRLESEAERKPPTVCR